MNVAYVYSIITRQIVGILALSNDNFAYYFEDNQLINLIETILKKSNIVSVYGVDKDIIYYDLTNPLNKDFLIHINYLLPWPYRIKNIEYKNIDPQDLYQLFSDIKNNQVIEGDNFATINQES